MTRNRFTYLVFLGILWLTACNNDQIYVADDLDYALLGLVTQSGGQDHFILPDSDDYGKIPQDPRNVLSDNKVELGKLLFFETGIALASMQPNARQTYSCATCHVPSAGFRPGNKQGIADGGAGFGYNGEERFQLPNYQEEDIDAQGVRPLSVLNVAYVTNTLWNGQFGSEGHNEGTEAVWALDSATMVNHLGYSALEGQNIEGLDLHRMIINREVLDSLGYTALFDFAFYDIPQQERYTSLTASFALSAYLRSLLTTDAPFQKWLKGDRSAMDDAEKRGAILFFDKANCVSCHRGKSFNADDFYAMGVNDLYSAGGLNTSADDKKNLGRGGFTRVEEDNYKFKVPQLYNLGDAPFFFHGSSKETLREVVHYFNNGIPENPNVPQSQIATGFRPLNLTNDEMDDLLVFLESALRDPNLHRYTPNELPSGNCFPNNDTFSQSDLGCN